MRVSKCIIIASEKTHICHNSGYKFAQVEMSKGLVRKSRYITNELTTIEIILATLLSKFSLTPTNDEIIWNLSQIISPSVKRSITNENGVEHQEKKGLPLFVQIINQDS